MTINFINSEKVKIDGEELVYLKETRALLKKIEETLSIIGPHNFFSSPNEDVKKVRESMAIVYLLLTFQSMTDEFIFCMQPKNDPPDFILMKIGNRIESLTIDSYELVEIPIRCKSFEEMMGIIQKKINKRYSESYNLLIFINNTKSKEWISLLDKKLIDYGSFKSVWTLHLLELNKDYWPVVNRLRPYPVKCIETKLEKIKLPIGVPDLMEESIHDNKKFISFKPELIKEFRNRIRKNKLNK